MTRAPDEPGEDDGERPVPLVWRPVLRQVVEALRQGDLRRAGDLPQVAPVDDRTAEQAAAYLADYGEVLVELPEASWDTSVAVWTGSCWDVLVDLWTQAEGRSDLVLHVQVVREDGQDRFRVHLVYVP